MINRNEYAWEDIQVVLPGKALPDDGVTAVEYTEKKEHTNVHARGDRAISMGRGKVEHEGSVTVLQSTLEAMQAALPKGKSLTSLAPFTITVSYAPIGGVATTDRLLFCRIKEVKKGMKTGDPNQEIPLVLAIGNIEYNV